MGGSIVDKLTRKTNFRRVCTSSTYTIAHTHTAMCAHLYDNKVIIAVLPCREG